MTLLHGPNVIGELPVFKHMHQSMHSRVFHDGVGKVIKSYMEKILTGKLSFRSVGLYSNHFPFVAGGETRRPASNGSCCFS